MICLLASKGCLIIEKGENTSIIPGELGKKEKQLRNSLLQQILNIPGGESIKKCIQCGCCTGSCPVSYMMDITPIDSAGVMNQGLSFYIFLKLALLNYLDWFHYF